MSKGYLIGGDEGFRLDGRGYKRYGRRGYLYESVGGDVNNLGDLFSMTINSLSENPVFRYRAQDAIVGSDWAKWGYGSDLTYAGSGTAPTKRSAEWGKYVDFVSGGKFWSVAGIGDLGTNDMVLELIIEVSLAQRAACWINKQVEKSVIGWSVHQTGSDEIRFVCNDGGGDVAVVTDDPVSYGFHHVMIFWDRSQASQDGCLIYVDGVPSGDDNCFDLTNIASGNNLELGDAPSGRTACEAGVMYAAMWLRSNWMPGGVTNREEADTIAWDRHQALLDTSITRPGIWALPPNMTINGVTESPDARYKGEDASVAAWPYWGYGADLAIYDAGSDPTVGIYHKWGDQVSFATGKYYIGGPSTDIDYRDFVIEAIIEFPSTALASGCWFNKQVQFNQNGWAMWQTAANDFYMNIYYGGTSRYLASADPNVGDVLHVLIFADRNEAVGNYAWCVYFNGVYSSASGIDMIQGNITSPNPFEIGGCPIGRDLCDSNVAYFAMWHSENWMQGGSANRDEWDAIAAARFAHLY